MIEPAIFFPTHLSGSELDVFLAKGWYRMGQAIFTTHGIVQQNQVFRVFWLRYPIQLLPSANKVSQKILEKNSCFHTSVVALHITEEMEALYESYKAGVNFDAAPDVNQWLFDGKTSNVFDTYAVEVRDEGRLIAVGIFDLGKKSIAGIMNFYHPSYKKYSPGKYLMLQKIKYAKENKIKWYYPGYIVAGYPKFDYKLFVDKGLAEIFIPEFNRWQVYDPSLINKLTYHYNER
ncbi:MAG: GNAT family N-acetyltransferase [Chitinophagaceae bacterium]|nr:MAG: GNAT family N-acetyltransferase [Chitinophagaceae bacterium]